MSDAKPDVPPPRYTQEGGWKQTILDEQEWLARPAPWGIDKLPDEVQLRKRNLFNAYHCGWLAGFIECAECRQRVQSLFTDDGQFPDYDRLADWDLDAVHGCDATAFRRQIRFRRRALITHPELENRFIEELHLRYALVKRRAERVGPPLTAAQHFDTGALALELIGPNPFRPITFAPEWRTDTALAIARGMYESRDFSAMPILADALQDAGCDDPDILAHCREEGATHVRGCWVVDLVLGKA